MPDEEAPHSLQSVGRVDHGVRGLWTCQTRHPLLEISPSHETVWRILLHRPDQQFSGFDNRIRLGREKKKKGLHK